MIKYIIPLLFCLPAYAQVGFSPNGQCETMAIGVIQDASTVDIAAYQFSSFPIANPLRGKQMRIVIDPTSSQDKALTGLNYRINHHYKIMHDKYIITDKAVFTGSYNFTYNAQHRNAENCIVLHDPAIIAQYQQNFEKLWSESR